MTLDDFDDETDWEEVFDRQAARGGLTDRFASLLELEPGDRLLELGCGPGYTTLELAAREVPAVVYAIDRRPGALRYLRAKESPLDAVELICGDVTALPFCPSRPTPVLAAFLLHHVDRPREAIEEIGAVLPSGSRLLVVEYDPGTPGEFGPPVEARIPRDRLETWLHEAGFDLERSVTLPEEKYGLVSVRR